MGQIINSKEAISGSIIFGRWGIGGKIFSAIIFGVEFTGGKKAVTMRVFVAGSSGAIGKSLVPYLLENGYEVVALVRTTQKAKEVEAMGAKSALANLLDKEELTKAIQRAEFLRVAVRTPGRAGQD